MNMSHAQSGGFCWGVFQVLSIALAANLASSHRVLSRWRTYMHGVDLKQKQTPVFGNARHPLVRLLLCCRVLACVCNTVCNTELFGSWFVRVASIVGALSMHLQIAY